MSKANLSNLGGKVTTRNISWTDLCSRAWGSEFRAPDHGVYEFSGGRKYDSTDPGITGIYSPNNNMGILIDGGRYLDMPAYVLAEDTTQLDQN